MGLFKSMDKMANTARTMVPGTIVPNLLGTDQISFDNARQHSSVGESLQSPKDVPMRFSAEQHLATAKRLREKAKSLAEVERLRGIQRSNSFLGLAVLAARNRGGVSLSGFDRDALNPDWTIIDEQVHRLASPQDQPSQDDRHTQVRQLIKQAIESPTAEDLADFLEFTNKFRRLAVWNARMAHIQRPGASIIATEFEWQTMGRYVQPDAVPIIILWPFSPIRFVYELADTGPTIDRESIKDSFAVKGQFRAGMLATLVSSLKKQKRFRISIEARRQGFGYAGSAAAQGILPITPSLSIPLGNGALISNFARENASSDIQENKRGIPAFRVTVNDRLQPGERFVTIAHELAHIFCGHLGECKSKGGNEEESGWRDRRSLGKNERELEAEAVAYLVASRAELVTGSTTYLKPYAQRADMKSIDIELIVRAAARIERLAKIHYGSMAFKPETQGRTINASPPHA